MISAVACPKRINRTGHVAYFGAGVFSARTILTSSLRSECHRRFRSSWRNDTIRQQKRRAAMIFRRKAYLAVANENTCSVPSGRIPRRSPSSKKNRARLFFQQHPFVGEPTRVVCGVGTESVAGRWTVSARWSHDFLAMDQATGNVW